MNFVFPSESLVDSRNCNRFYVIYYRSRRCKGGVRSRRQSFDVEEFRMWDGLIYCVYV